jgi:hypothetical protein
LAGFLNANPPDDDRALRLVDLEQRRNRFEGTRLEIFALIQETVAEWGLGDFPAALIPSGPAQRILDWTVEWTPSTYHQGKAAPRQFLAFYWALCLAEMRLVHRERRCTYCEKWFFAKGMTRLSTALHAAMLPKRKTRRGRKRGRK